ncbi:MAG: L-seryl-tRNA(Sec) selenium transferase [Polyangia bacterium]|jgi:L-seryl-tRNA(Ser) seleniumtransferase|nr:L-seryl-tRNA(Sec) selenium transferase [Polyangia bacterium]
MDDKTQALLRQLPSVQEVLSRPEIQALAEEGIGDEDRRDAAREALDTRRKAILEGSTEDAAVHSAEVISRARRMWEPSLVPIVNATGVVIHTNLGRAPLPLEVFERMAAVACGYSNLEYDLEGGARGHRHAHAARLLARTAGAEAALVVNNCAAAVLLGLTGLAQGREVIVSRGEEVEIGGAFRVPDVMRQSGARLVEVGTTNRTRLDDYRRAITSETALLLKVHRSNFALIGFTEEVPLAELAALGKQRGIPTMMDLGSGLLARPEGGHLSSEPTVAEAVQSGVDLVTISGDKLLGGPQAGILVGRAELISRLSGHPLMRALRPCKLTFAALQGVLAMHASHRAWTDLPTARMLRETAAEVTVRRDALLGALGEGKLGDLRVRPVATTSRPGGGSSPLAELPSAGLALSCPRRSAEVLAAALRNGSPAVIGRIEDDLLLLDLRTVLHEQLGSLAESLRALAAKG